MTGQVIRLQQAARVHDLESCIGAFLSYSRSKNLSVRTLEFYQDRLGGFAKYAAEHYPSFAPDDFTPQIIRDFVGFVHGSSSAASANHSLAVVKRLFNFLHAEGFTTANPAAGVAKLKEPQKIIATFSEQEIEAILAACDGKDFYDRRDRAVILTLLDTGIRSAELCGLELDAVDWTAQTLRVFGKGSKERIVPFGASVRQALSAWLSKRGESLDTPVIFVSHYGVALDRFRLRELIRRRCQQADISGVRCSPHTFRHTAAVNYLRAGGDSFSLQMLLGHVSQAVTQRYCQSLTATDLQEKHRRFSPADNMKCTAAKSGRRRLR